MESSVNDNEIERQRNRTKFPTYGWKIKLDHVFPESRNQFMKPKLCQVLPLICLAIRYIFYAIKILWSGKRLLMNYFKPITGKQIYGVPLGGIGGGSIGRGFKGEFCRYQMKPGLYDYEVVDANQFIVTIQNESNETLYQQVLSPNSKPKSGLSSWNWNFKGSDAQYCALYPRSWTLYDIPEQEIQLMCRQISPVIPHNYKDSCVPGAVFVWSIQNLGSAPRNVSITLTFKNGTGTKEDREGGCWSELFHQAGMSGVLIHQSIRDMPCTYGVAAHEQKDVKVTRMVSFDPYSDGADLWQDLLKDGELDPSQERSSTTGKELSCAVCVKCRVPQGGSAQAELALVWDMPKIHFTGRRQQYHRYYTKWFGDGGNVAPLLVHYALTNYQRWESEIEKWQQPILDDPDLPDWYKSAIFNELYYVADGGSVWTTLPDPDKFEPSDPRHEFGQFAYLEGHEYRMYNTYDVHFYASFALAVLWPRLQEVLQYHMRDTIDMEDTTKRSHLYDGKVNLRKVLNSVPHDIGDPEEDPFMLINSYPVHDVSEWRDLNLKFVLQCYRDACLFGGQRFVQAMWPQVLAVMNKALEWDKDGDGLIENGGAPDQTYDTWVMKGPSAYCGSLWVASLYCVYKMAEMIGNKEESSKYRQILEKGKQAFEDKLWNGEYYNFDCSSGSHSRSIMSDQLCGLWYLRASSVTDEIFSEKHSKCALKKIYNFNVMKFKKGTMGAVNGMTPDGQVDQVTIQSGEVWTGVVYGLAALMIHEGMVEEAFATAKGIYHTVYNVIGQGFETPEALYEEKHYRAVGYMRPLSIWGMQHAWHLRHKK